MGEGRETYNLIRLLGNQRTICSVNAHLIWPRKSTKQTKPRKKQGKEMTLTFNTRLLSFTE